MPNKNSVLTYPILQSHLRRNRFSAIFYFMIPTVVYYGSNLAFDYPRAFWGTTFLMGVFIFLRMLICSDTFIRKVNDEKKWFYIFFLQVIGISAVSGIPLGVVVARYPFFSAEVVSYILPVAFISAGAQVNLTSNLWLARVYVSLMILPLTFSIGFFSNHTTYSFPIAMGVFFFWLFSILQIKSINRFIFFFEKQKQDLKDTEEKLWDFVDSIPGLVSWFDANLCYIAANKRLLQSTGYNRAQILGKHVGFSRSESDPFVHELAKFAGNSDRTLIQEFEYDETKEKKYQYLITVFNKHGHGKNMQISALSLDISDIKLKEKNLEEQKLSLIEHEKFIALGEMAGGIAHEVNNPLAIIAGKAEYLSSKLKRGDYPKDDLIKGLEVVEKTAHRIHKIINSLRKLAKDSRIEGSTQYPVAEVIGSVIDITQSKLQNSNIQIIVEHENDNFEVSCSLVEIGQVLMNLIINSSHAVENLNEKWIKLKSFKKDQTIHILVQDSGPGIPEAVQKKLFSPFFTTKGPGKGTGIGLSLSKRLMQQMDGDLYYDANYKNTTFVIVLKSKSDNQGSEAA